MPRTPEEYKVLRNRYKPEEIKLIFLLESPPANGAYFYDPESLHNEFLFMAMMKIIGFRCDNLNREIKILGLNRFQEEGYFLIDATYQPVNDIFNPDVKNNKIFQDSELLLADLNELKAKENKTPIILVKTNIFTLYNDFLTERDFNIYNENITVPFPSTGQQISFHQRIDEVLCCHKILNDQLLAKSYLSYGIPHEYITHRAQAKAIVLGADPSNFSDSGKTVKLNTVFALGSPEKRYFKAILNNLKSVGLNLGNIYVQNLVRNYMTQETSDNKLWLNFVEIWKPLLKQDLDILNPQRNLPILATAECILNALLNHFVEKIPAKDYFEKCIVIKPEQNYLERTIIPCFRRHYAYQTYPKYADIIKKNLI